MRYSNFAKNAARSFILGCFLFFCPAGNAASTQYIHPISDEQTTLPPIEKTALVGRTTTIINLRNINPDCTVRALPTIRILEEPIHGTTKIYKCEDYPNYPKTNPRSTCNKTKLLGMCVNYTPEADYTGDDSLSVEVITKDGADISRDVLITVKE